MKMQKNKVDYTIWSVPEKFDAWGIEILSGEFKDTVIEIDELNFADEDGTLTFDFYITKFPEGMVYEDVKSNPNFDEVLQSILLEIITSAIDFAKNQEQND
jgi:hypothetical protein